MKTENGYKLCTFIYGHAIYEVYADAEPKGDDLSTLLKTISSVCAADKALVFGWQYTVIKRTSPESIS